MFYRTLAAASLLATQVHADQPTVVTDIAPVHSLVARVMQGVGEPTLLMKQGASPHGYSLRPSEAAALQDADLVVWIGEDLTPWLERAIDTLASDAHSLELLHAEGTQLLQFREETVFGEDEDHHEDHDDHGHKDEHHDEDHGEHDEDHHDEHKNDAHDEHHEEHEHEDEHHGEDHGEHDDDHHDEHNHDAHDDHDEHHDEHDTHKDHDDHGHEEHGHDDHGHDHDGEDPHAWMDPDNAIAWLSVIAEELSELDPANAELYATNAAAGATELAAVAENIAAQLEPFHEARFLVFHDAYQYFEHAFDLKVTGAIHLSDASAPSAGRLAELQAEIKEHGISCVFAEPQFDPSIVAAITPDGTKTGVLDPLATDTPKGPALYTTWLQGMADSVTNCLK